MADFVYNLFSLLFQKSNILTIFYCCLALESLTFVVFIILSLKLQNFGKNKKIFFLFPSLMFFLFLYGGEFFAQSNTKLWIIYCFFANIYQFVLFFIKEKSINFKKEHLSLAKNLDQQAESRLQQNTCLLSPKSFQETINATPKNTSFPQSTISFPDNNLAVTEKKKDTFCELNFSHVKKIIERLDFFSLSPTDRRQVHELEVYLAEAQRQGLSEQLKYKINDGLGGLLKILSKYEV